MERPNLLAPASRQRVVFASCIFVLPSFRYHCCEMSLVAVQLKNYCKPCSTSHATRLYQRKDYSQNDVASTLSRCYRLKDVLIIPGGADRYSTVTGRDYNLWQGCSRNREKDWYFAEHLRFRLKFLQSGRGWWDDTSEGMSKWAKYLCGFIVHEVYYIWLDGKLAERTYHIPKVKGPSRLEWIKRLFRDQWSSKVVLPTLIRQ